MSQKFLTLTMLTWLLLVISMVDGHSAIIEVSIPMGSTETGTTTANDNIWTATAVNGVLDTAHGIGAILRQTYQVGDDLAMNIHYSGFAPFSNNHPSPDVSTITYYFDTNTTVRGFAVIQHVNGITKLSAMLGASIGSLANLGSTFGPAGDVVATPGVPSNLAPDGTIQIFDFGNATLAGYVLQVFVDKTWCSDCFGTFAIAPLDASLNFIPAANSSQDVAEPTTLAVLAVGAIGLALGRKNCFSKLRRVPT